MGNRKMKWQQLEDEVRRIAEAHWNRKCEPRVLHGVKCDGVLKLSKDHWIAIEISKSNTLEKLREDLSKFAMMRQGQFIANQIYTECIFVTEGDTSSLKESGKSQKVEVLSISEFSEKFIGRDAYSHVRKTREFGSAVDPDSGKSDDAQYAIVSYIENKSGNPISLSDIAKRIQGGMKIILLGEFGSGKSRCIREVFSLFINDDSLYPTLAINLRDCWGLRTFDLIIRHHMQSLGLSSYADNIIKLAQLGKVRLLLDGFYEIGSQS